MDVKTTVFSVLVGIAGILFGWWLRNHENGRVRASARGALVAGIVMLLGLFWQALRG